VTEHDHAYAHDVDRAPAEHLPHDVVVRQGAHDYLSTACWHGLHPRCRDDCKFCAAECACRCHRAKSDDDNGGGSARSEITAFITEWTHAAGAPLGYVHERLEPLLDRFAFDVRYAVEKRTYDEAIREALDEVQRVIDAQDWTDLLTDGLTLARGVIRELLINPTTEAVE